MSLSRKSKPGTPTWAVSVPGLAGVVGLAALAVGLVACGGGGADPVATSPLASPVTATAFSQGTITGFGSIVVNGVRFDETSASISDDAGNAVSAQSLQLGMRVEVDHAAVDANSASARASAVRFGSLALGPVSAVSVAGSSLTVLGQVVDVNASTVFSDNLSGGLSALATGAVVEVHGQVDSTSGHIVATRVSSAASATSYKLRGTVAGLDTTAKTFSIGAAAVSYATLASTAVPTTLANGSVLRVQLATAQSGGFWVAQSLGVRGARMADPANGLKGQVRGKITAWTSATSFTVDSVVVDASAATFPDGSSGVVLGAEVEVKGTVTNGVLVATQVELESRHQADDSRKWHLFGAITALDTAAKTFVVRGVTVTYSDATTYTGGVLADLAVGRKVHVKGAVGSTRTQVQAAVVSFE